MAGSTSDDSSLESLSSSAEVISTGQVCQTSDSVGEWRSSEQVENGTPSTSPPYWDTDDEDDFGEFVLLIIFSDWRVLTLSCLYSSCMRFECSLSFSLIL